MGAIIHPTCPLAKGPVPCCLDEISRGRGARERLQRLHDAIAAIAPHYRGLADVFGEHLLGYVFRDADERRRIVRHLQVHWFDDASAEAFFPGQGVAVIYGQGVLKTLELSLRGRPPVPINAWWLVEAEHVRMLNIADVDSDGVPISSLITLLITTPRPKGAGTSDRVPIHGEVAHAWMSARQDGEISTTEMGPSR
jgi:hypothetical protein